MTPPEKSGPNIGVVIVSIAFVLFCLSMAGVCLQIGLREVSEDAFDEGKAVGEQLGYDHGFRDGDHNGRKECCRAVCAADGSLGLFDEGGCFCVAPKVGADMLKEAEEQGLLEKGALQGIPQGLPPSRGPK